MDLNDSIFYLIWTFFFLHLVPTIDHELLLLLYLFPMTIKEMDSRFCRWNLHLPETLGIVVRLIRINILMNARVDDHEILTPSKTTVPAQLTATVLVIPKA